MFIWIALAAGALQAQTGTAGWTLRAKAGDVIYFAFATPARLERYDLVNERWLGSVSLTATPSALHVDATSIYAAYDRSLVKRALDGSNEKPVYNAAKTINGLLGDSTYLFAFTPSGSQSNIFSLRKSDDQYVNTWSSYYSFSSGFSIAPNARRIYGVNTSSSSFSTLELPYTAAGGFGTVTERPSDSGNFNENARTYVYPDEQNVVRHNGMVYATPGLTYRASLAGAFDDADFFGADVLIVLRSNQLYAYANTLLEAGTYKLPAAGQAIAVRGASVYVFALDPAQTSGIGVTKVAVGLITAAQPGAAIDPEVTPFVPDEIIPAGDDTFFLFSRTLQSIFRWSAATRRYTASLPLIGSPEKLAYSPALNRLYCGYSTGRINQIKLDQGATAEVPFANLPMAVRGLQAAGDLVMAADDSGAWMTHYVYSAAGALLASKDWNYYSQEYIWSPTARRLYFFRDDSSPNDLHYEVIDASGQFGKAGETPYHGDYNFIHPICVSDDETGVLIGSGVVFAATDLKYAGSLANNITAAASLNNRWVTLRASGTDSQVQTWTANLLFDKGLTVPGAPLRLYDLADGRVVAFTSVGKRMVTSLVDLAGTGTVTTSPIVTVDPLGATSYVGLATTLSVTARGTDLSYQWLKNNIAIPGATSVSLGFTSLQLSDAGNYTVRVSNPLGSVTSAVAALTVKPPLEPAPTLTRAPVGITGQRGTAASLTVLAAGTGLTYEWRKNGTVITGANTATLKFPSLLETDAGQYSVRVSNTGGSVTSASVSVTVVTISAQPQSRTLNSGSSASFSVTASSAVPLGFQWRHNGVAIPGATGSTLTLTPVQWPDVGTYDVLITAGSGRVTSAAAVLGINSNSKVMGSGVEMGTGIRHPNGNVFDQVLLTGAIEAITADWAANKVTRTSYIDLNNDIVQIEFSGPGTLSVVLEGSTGPSRPVNYSQEVDYVKGHAGIVISGADERTHVSVFTVGRATAFDPTGAFNPLQAISETNKPSQNGSPLFQGHGATVYDGVADLAFIAISSANGKFGGVRAANAHFFAHQGFTGIYAPGVSFEGPVYFSDITAFDGATPVLITGTVTDARVTGGDLLQDNGAPVKVSGITALKFVGGTTSNGDSLPAQANKGVLQQDGTDVTNLIVVNPR